MLSRSLQHQIKAEKLQVGRRSLLIGGSILGLCADYATAVVFAVTYAGGNALPMGGSIASVVLVRCTASMTILPVLPCACPLQHACSLLAMLCLLSLSREAESNPQHTLTGQQLTHRCVKMTFPSRFCAAVQICLYGISFGFSWGPIGGCFEPSQIYFNVLLACAKNHVGGHTKFCSCLHAHMLLGRWGCRAAHRRYS